MEGSNPVEALEREQKWIEGVSGRRDGRRAKQYQCMVHKPTATAWRRRQRRLKDKRFNDV